MVHATDPFTKKNKFTVLLNKGQMLYIQSLNWKALWDIQV